MTQPELKKYLRELVNMHCKGEDRETMESIYRICKLAALAGYRKAITDGEANSRKMANWAEGGLS